MIKLIPKITEITLEGELLIKKFAIIDGETGEELRIAKVTPELEKLIKSIEIDITNYMNFIHIKEKNSNFMKLVSDFNLILTRNDYTKT